MKTIELLAPAGNLEKLQTAFLYGADAVYVGGQEFSLRAKAGNFTLEELQEGRRISRSLGKKLYVALNIFPHNQDLEGISSYLRELESIGVDALILSDPGVIWLAQKHAPSLPIHLSTQANTQNWAACSFWREQGVERVVLGREVSMSEIKEIADRSSMELEAFVHGAMCMAYSGRCMLSMHLTGRSANSGSCTHPCRWEYYVVEKQRKSEYMPIEEDERGTYIFNSKDLCVLPQLEAFIDSGITSLKIEGRMKSIHYVATTTKAYREALDLILENRDFEAAIPHLMEELNGIGERAYTMGFYGPEPDSQMQQYDPTNVEKYIRFVGKVLENQAGELVIEQRNKFNKGDVLEVLQPYGPNLTFRVESIVDMEGNPQGNAPHPRQMLRLKAREDIMPGALLRIRTDRLEDDDDSTEA